MRVDKINNEVYTKRNTNFKHGLTADIVNHVKSMDKEEYRNITERVWKKYGIISHVGASNTVAYCLETTADIMAKAGLTLPKVFTFELLESPYFGEFNKHNCVSINSGKPEFLDLEQLDKMEEQYDKRSGIKRHFLDTYIHEFLHAAHYGNVIKEHGTKDGNSRFFNSMAFLSPYFVIERPLTNYLQKLFPNFYRDALDETFSYFKRCLQTDDITEYFAEKNTLVLSQKLGENLNTDGITEDFTSELKPFPKNWSIKKQEKYLTGLSIKYSVNKVFDMVSLYKSPKVKEHLQEEVVKSITEYTNYIDGEIWNGNIENLRPDSVTLFKIS